MQTKILVGLLFFVIIFSPKLSAEVSILFLGDIFPGGRVQMNYLLGRETLDPALKKLIDKADIVIGNFECAASYHPVGADKMYLLRLIPDLPSPADEFKLTAVTVANNHILDYGNESLNDTLTYLRLRKILVTGAGSNLDEAMKPAIITTKTGETVRLFGFSAITPSFFATSVKPGTCPANGEIIKRTLQKYASNKGIDIVYFHFGQEYSPHVTDEQRRLVQTALDNGADIVVGSHAHVVQPWEMIGGKPVFFGLGNTLFDIDDKLYTKPGIVPFITVKKDKTMTVSVHSIISEPGFYLPKIVPENVVKQ